TIYISPQVKDILGFTPEEWMADPNIWEKQIHPEDHERVMAEEQASRAKDYPFVAEYRIRTKDGRVVWLHDETYHITDVPGVPPYSQGIEFDITERMERDRELQAIANISASLRAAQTLDQMLPILLDSSMKAVNAASGDVWLADLTKNELHMVFERGRVGEPLPNIKFGEGIVGHVTASGEVYVSQEWRTDPKVHESARNLIQPGLGGACIPIRAADKIIGAFFINMESPFKLKDADIHLLTTLAEIGGNAIQRASLYEQTVKQVEQLAALRAIDLMITSSLDLRMTLNVVLDQVINQLKIDAASILTFGQESKILRYAAGKGFWTNQIEATALRLGEGLPSQAVLQRQIVYVEDLKGAANAARLELLGDEKFVSYYAIPLIAKGKVKGVLEIFNRSKLSRSTEWQKFLEALGDQAAIAIDNSSLFLDLQRSNLELALAYDATIEGWSHALDLRDKETEGHTQRVTEMTLRLARAMGISEEDLVHMRRGALLHDIGKMGVPDNILLKPDKLTDEEWKIMRKHPDFANDMLSEIIYLRQALSIPYCHHEKWDGSGYPRGLKSEEIPLPARIFAIVDVWDALSSDRPYRPGWKKADVMKYIREQSGTHFDPRVVEAFLQLMSNGHFA
ncbi:MAG TPA: HD domain-containing phosphohydrolase, partial [Anaerolineales bacterium]|nr:HD domain-containing phosphohydrolase [Anaerolineales bacterium]